MLGIEPSAFVSKIDILTTTPIVQHITDPTQYRAGQNSNTHNFLFINEEYTIENLLIEPPHGMSDHVGLFLKKLCYTSKSHRSE